MQITRYQIKNNLILDIDEESVSIYVYTGKKEPAIPLVYWHIGEVKEDENVVISMVNAVKLYYTNRIELITKLGHTIIDNGEVVEA